jgi:hypothetical protein
MIKGVLALFPVERRGLPNAPEQTTRCFGAGETWGRSVGDLGEAWMGPKDLPQVFPRSPLRHAFPASAAAR